MTSAHSNFKLINETNKMIKKLINISPKDVNRQTIEYLIFHKNGICSALLRSNLSKGEILILSRFLNLVFTSNLMSLSEISDENFGKLLMSLLNSLKIHRNHYFWTTVLSIFNQESAIEFLGQSKQMMREIRAIVTDQSAEAINLVKLSLINISNFIGKLLEHILNNFEHVNIDIIHVITRVSCYLVMHLLEETGLSGLEISSITKYLFQISATFKEKSVAVRQTSILKEEVLTILKKLNSENVLNLIPEVIVFIHNFLSYMSVHFDKNEVIQSLCKCCSSMLQRTTVPKESLQIISIARNIVNMGLKITKEFLHDETKVKSLMGFIKILPSTVDHSDARNFLWWHILCSLSPYTFQNRFKTYFVPLIENILGVYLDSNNNSYGISDFSLSSGYMHISHFANHVMSNVLDNIDFDSELVLNIKETIRIPPSVNLAKLDSMVFTPDITSSSENMTLILNAIEIWINIVQSYHLQISKAQKEKKMRNINNSIHKRPLKNRMNTYASKRNSNKVFCKAGNSNNCPTKCTAMISSSDELSLCSNSTQENNKQSSCSRDYIDSSSSIPEISVEKENSCSRKHRIGHIIKEKIKKSPSPTEGLFDLQKILEFFKFRIPEPKPCIKKHSQEVRAVEDINQKHLPLKKRKVDMDLMITSNIPVQNDKNHCSSHHSIDKSNETDNDTEAASNNDQDNSSSKIRHKYYIRNNPYGMNQNTFPEESRKSSTKGTLSKSNVDFSVNVSETSKQPKCGDRRYKNNKSNSKKVEFKIKFDLNPLSKMCSKGIKLDIMKSKCPHTSNVESKLIKNGFDSIV